METSEMMMRTRKAASLLRLVITFIDSVEGNKGYCFDDIRDAIEVAQDELMAVQLALHFSKIS